MISEPYKAVFSCPACGSQNVSFSDEPQTFVYGTEPNRAELRAVVPVGHCTECGLEFTDRRAELRKHDAVCEHLGFLTPTQIGQRRKSWGMSRQMFADLTGIGEASLSRWERAAGIQNPALDQYLYLLGFADNVARLRGRAREVHVAQAQEAPAEELASRFPNLKKLSDKQDEAKVFKLRSAVG